MFYVPVPTSAAAAALVALLRGWTVAARINNRGPMGPGVAGFAVVFAIA